MNRRPRVVVPVEMGSRFFRELYRGVAQYSHVPPRPFDVVFVTRDKLGALRPAPDGIIATATTRSEFEEIKAMRLATVSCCDRFEIPGVPTVIVNDLMAGRIAAEHLLGCGFRDFGFYGQSEGLTYIRRREGFVRALKEVATECSFQLRKPGRGIDRPGIAERKALQRWLADLPRPVGILCSSDWDAWDVYDACEQLGIRIRDEVGVVGMDNEDIYCQSLNPPLSSVERRPDRVGYEAAALMVKVLRGEGAPSEPILIAPLGVVQRESTDVFAGNDPHVATVARHIRDHAEQPLQVRDLLHLVPVSRRVLERRFRKHLSRSILEEIHRAKLNRIKHLLTDTDHTIDEISFLCGFPNSSHMTALFRQKTGQTPSEYRRQFRDKQSAQFDELASIRSRGPRPMSQIR